MLLCCYSFVYLLTGDENVNTQREETENTKDKTASSAIHELPNRHTGERRDGGTGEFSGDGRKLQAASSSIELIGRWKKKTIGCWEMKAGCKYWRQDTQDPPQLWTRWQTSSTQYGSRVPNTRHQDQIYFPHVPPVSPWVWGQDWETDVLYLGRSGNTMRSEEVSHNTPTILLEWILPVREIWNSDTHTECVCVWWQLYKQYSFPTCETPVSPLHRRRKWGQRIKDVQSHAQILASTQKLCIYISEL